MGRSYIQKPTKNYNFTTQGILLNWIKTNTRVGVANIAIAIKRSYLSKEFTQVSTQVCYKESFGGGRCVNWEIHRLMG